MSDNHPQLASKIQEQSAAIPRPLASPSRQVADPSKETVLESHRLSFPVHPLRSRRGDYGLKRRILKIHCLERRSIDGAPETTTIGWVGRYIDVE